MDFKRRLLDFFPSFATPKKMSRRTKLIRFVVNNTFDVVVRWKTKDRNVFIGKRDHQRRIGWLTCCYSLRPSFSAHRQWIQIVVGSCWSLLNYGCTVVGLYTFPCIAQTKNHQPIELLHNELYCPFSLFPISPAVDWFIISFLNDGLRSLSLFFSSSRFV